ncbi:MAG: aldehyde dehydrogenase family protein [Bdellovibrionales bacterium]|nr:aldehyde dehydrogenase family protein [Bdellovibrionales bacterium]
MNSLLQSLGLKAKNPGCFSTEIRESSGNYLSSYSPVDGAEIATVEITSEEDYDWVVERSRETFLEWRRVPAPKRGEVIRRIGNAFRDLKQPLGELVTREMGKIRAEGEGEIQEAIDIADFAVGLSRQLYGKTMHSERASHRMYEQWHPLGPVGVITAFNFPAAVWAWNAMIAAVCGDVVVWKPSEIAPLTAVALNKIAHEVAAQEGFPGLFSLVVSDGPELGKKMAADSRFPLISATGSCRMGRSVGEVVASRFGKSLLELGGNNAAIVMPDAELDLVLPGVLFGAVGTAGQRCTSLRRLLVHRSIEKEVLEKLLKAYQQVRIGDPLDEKTLMGPLVHEQAVRQYLDAIKAIKDQGGEIVYGGASLPEMPSPLYVLPTIVSASRDMPIVQHETFAPILYVIGFDTLDEAIDIQNSVPQGLSSAIFTTNLKNAEAFLSHGGSDCGIANVNIGTSGAEIGGAFGGEKETGGGRESGSDSWKQYMRRQTNTINFSSELPLAQGIRFEL